MVAGKLDELDIKVIICEYRVACELSGYCVQNILQSVRVKKYTCKNGSLLGDRLFLRRHGQE